MIVHIVTPAPSTQQRCIDVKLLCSTVLFMLRGLSCPLLALGADCGSKGVSLVIDDNCGVCGKNAEALCREMTV